jgi:hypothetical protein
VIAQLIEVNADRPRVADEGLRTRTPRGGAAMSTNESMPKWPMPNFSPVDFTKLGKEQADALAEMQRELTRLIEQANADWLARLELERDLASDLTGKLSAAKSLPDAAKAYQEWMARRMETMTKDSQKFLSDSQKFVASMNRFLMSGGKGGTS